MVTKQIFGDEEGFIFLTGRLVNEQKCLCRARRRRRGGGRDTILLLPKTQVFSRQRYYSIVAQVFSRDNFLSLPKTQVFSKSSLLLPKTQVVCKRRILFTVDTVQRIQQSRMSKVRIVTSRERH